MTGRPRKASQMARRLRRIWARIRNERGRSGIVGVVRMIATYILWRLRGQPKPTGPPSLEDWYKVFGELRPERLPNGGAAFSVICPVYNTPPDLLQACVTSVQNQTYDRWELLLIDDASTDPDTVRALGRLALDPGIRVLTNHENLGIARTTNRGVAEADGEYVVFVDHDDLLAPTALEWVASAIEEGADLVYSDEDKVVEGNLFEEPFFKPAWSPRLLLSLNYVNHLLCVRTSLVRELGGLREGFDGAQDHDLLLRLAELPLTVAHLPNLLYHWRKWEGSTAWEAGSKLEAEEAGLRAVRDAVERRQIEAAEARLGPGDPFRYRIHFHSHEDPPVVKVVMPTRDGLKLLRQAVRSLAERTEDADLHLVIVDNGSQESQTLRYLREIQRANPRRVTIKRIDEAFNFSFLCNEGSEAGPDTPFLLLLNNDVEVLYRRWLVQLLGWLGDPEVVAVGPKLLYPDRTIQHAGVVLGMGGVAGHYSAHQEDQPRPGDLHDQAREVGCLTAACLLVRTDDYWKIGGFDESLAIDFQDVDFCLRLRTQLNGVLMYDPTYPLIHHESATRGTVGASSGYTVSRLRFRWREHFELGGDPYYNPHLTLWHHDQSLADLPQSLRELSTRLRPRIARPGTPENVKNSAMTKARPEVVMPHRQPEGT